MNPGQQQQNQQCPAMTNNGNSNHAGVAQQLQTQGGGQGQPSMGPSVLTANQVPPHLLGLMASQGFTAGTLFPAMMAANSNAAAAGFLAMQQDPTSFAAAQSLGLMPNMNAAMNHQQQMTHQQNNNINNTPIAPMACVNAMMGGGQASRNQSLPLPPVAHASVGGGDADGSVSSQQQSGKHKRTELTVEERARQNRDRNREHARSTRLRKKAYVQKLKELVEGLHAERTEEVRQRRVAIQHLAEVQNVRRAVVRNFLRMLANFETEHRKWATILEDDFWLKQPVTPFRSFRRAEIEKECRVTRGIEAMISEAASVSVMIESIGSRSHRWMQIKRDEFVQLLENRRGAQKLPQCVIRQDSKLQHAISSLSSSSGSSNHGSSSSGEDTGRQKASTSSHAHARPSAGEAAKQAAEAALKNAAAAKKVSSSSGSNSSDTRRRQPATSNDFHDYHAKPLPDPKLGDFEDNSPLAEDLLEESNDSSNVGKRISTDSSSGDDSAAAVISPRPTKRRKHSDDPTLSSASALDQRQSTLSPLPPNIARQGGIPHNIQPSVAGNGTSRLQVAPAIPLPPFSGIGKRSIPAPDVATQSKNGSVTGKDSGRVVTGGNGSTTGPAFVSADAETSSNSSTSKVPQIRGSFHINEDDMILMENILMCPFIFRSQDAVVCGALADCVMPGMLRAHFSSRNKIASMELVYDAMGFMQQLERSSGNDGTAQIIPGSLEMALTPSVNEARVITTAQAPFLIVNVNDVWTRTTGYTQMEVEGEEYLKLLEGEGTLHAAKERSGRPPHKLEEVAKGKPACSTNIHYDKEGKDFIEFVCSYPLTNANDQITHILHVSKELPLVHNSSVNHQSARQ